MALAKSLFINKFEKGTQENPSIGYGAMVGYDMYSKKGIAQLAKKSTCVYDLESGGLGEYPHFFAVSGLGTTWWMLSNLGNVYYASSASASNWISAGFPTGATGGVSGNGMINFQNYMFVFTNTNIYYTASNTPTAGTWVNWTDTKSLGVLASPSDVSSSPITALHYPFLFPSNRGVYFGNASSNGVVGFWGQNGTTTFDPAGTAGTGFLYNNTAFSPPSNTYITGVINFLPPNNLAIASYAFQDPASADLITWDTVSSNKFSPPLRLPSAQQANSAGVPINSGIKQMVNRNQVLYAVSGGNHTIYETNSANFNLIDSLNLYSNVRGTGGAETNLPPFFNSYPQAITVMGNKILTGVSTPPNNSLYPTGGIFPFGVWSIAFHDDGTKSTQCEFTLPTIFTGGVAQTVIVSPTGANSYAKITSLMPVSTNKLLVGYRFYNANLGSVGSGIACSGIALVDTTAFIDDITKTSMESPMWEIGTSLNPQAVNNIETILAKPLLTGQTIDISYRTSLASDWTILDTFTGDGTKNNYPITKNPIGAVQYLQLRVRMATGGSNTTDSPYLRNVIVS